MKKKVNDVMAAIVWGVALIGMVIVVILAIISVVQKKRIDAYTPKSRWTEIYSCGSCGYLSDTKWHYCPLCGADNSERN